jgi:hypothetical protein
MTDKIHPSWNEHPNLLSELNPEGNKGFTHLGKPVSVLELAAGTGKKLDWKCRTCENNWKATGDSRKNGNGCPACAGQKIHSDGRNSMAQTHPELASEYQGDATKVMAGTNKRLDWKCSTCEHEWTAMGASRVKRQASGCPPCGRKKQAENKKTYHLQKNGSMAETHPELAIEYQGDATKIIAGTNYLLDWKCRTCDHEWKAAGSNRSAGKGCPACSNHVINNQHGRNSMAQTHPELAKEYQGDATKVIAGNTKKLDWKCSTCDHEWKAAGRNRVHNSSGCPACATFGFKPDEPAHYYVHKITSELGNLLYYKAGISKGWQRRLSQIRNTLPVHHTIENCEVIPFEVGQDALNLEKTLLRMAAEEGWKAPAQPFDGGHELFTQNPLDIAREKQLLK